MLAVTHWLAVTFSVAHSVAAPATPPSEASKVDTVPAARQPSSLESSQAATQPSENPPPAAETTPRSADPNTAAPAPSSPAAPDGHSSDVEPAGSVPPEDPATAPENSPARASTPEHDTSESMADAMGAGWGLDVPTASARKNRAGTPAKAESKATRRYLIGLEGVGLQGPTLRLHVAELDLRTVGERTSFGGFGIMGRVAASDRVSAQLGVRTGMVKFRDGRQGRELRHSLTLVSAGAIVFVASGQMGRLGLEGGAGGMWNRLSYELGDLGAGVQRFAAFQTYVGLAGEFEAKRIIVTISLRSYGVVTKQAAAKVEGPLFEGVEPESTHAPVARLQAYLAAALGVAYRF